MSNAKELCSWVRPRPGHVVVYPGRGDLLAYDGPLVSVQVESNEDRCWGIVQASAVDDIKPHDCVLYTKFEGMTGPSLDPERAPLIIRGDSITCVLDMGELDRLKRAMRHADALAAASLEAERQKLREEESARG
jgi:hypothetical protein